MGAARAGTVALAGAQIACRCHVCAFVRSPEEEYAVLLPFLKEGVLRGDNALNVIDAGRIAERQERLASAGIDAGLVEMKSWQDVYLRRPRFDVDLLLTQVEEMAREAGAQGSGVTRSWANMEWALQGRASPHDLLAYESRLNQLLPSYDVVAVCAYDISRFNAATLVDVLRAHPMVIMDGVLRENPYYSPPEQFLRELAERKRPLH